MRPFIYILLILFFNSCLTKSNKDIFIVPFERQYAATKINVDTVSHALVFSDAFWKHFTSTFPSATIVLFNRRGDDYDNNLQLSDTSYSYGLITRRNRIFFMNHLPKNLSKEESKSYWEGIGPFIIRDSSNNTDKHQPEVTLERHWSKATEKVETEYLKFYSLIDTSHLEYAIVIKRKLLDSIMLKYQ